jgi:hypothetical protein
MGGIFMVYLLSMYRLLLQQAGGDEPSVLSYNVWYRLQEKNGDAIRKASNIFFLKSIKNATFSRLLFQAIFFQTYF